MLLWQLGDQPRSILILHADIQPTELVHGMSIQARGGHFGLSRELYIEAPHRNQQAICCLESPVTDVAAVRRHQPQYHWRTTEAQNPAVPGVRAAIRLLIFYQSGSARAATYRGMPEANLKCCSRH